MGWEDKCFPKKSECLVESVSWASVLFLTCKCNPTTLHYLCSDRRIKSWLTTLRREPVEITEREREFFFKNPFKFVKSLVIKERGGNLKTSKQELEEHQPSKVERSGECSEWARVLPAPGPNGVLYRLHKSVPGVQRFLGRLMKAAWEKGIIPKDQFITLSAAAIHSLCLHPSVWTNRYVQLWLAWVAPKVNLKSKMLLRQKNMVFLFVK